MSEQGTSAKRPMSDEHRAALSLGRARSRAVRNYLEALESHRPKRGRRRTPEAMRERIDAIDNELGDANPMQRLRLTQERIDLVAKIEATETTVDISALEDEFVAVASAYGENNGISYAAWRAVGVSAAVLKRAGVSRSA